MITVAATNAAGALGVRGGGNNLVAAFKATEDALRRLSPETRKQIEAGFQLGRSVEEIAKALGITTDAVELYHQRMEAATWATKEMPAEWRELQGLMAA